MYHLKPCLLFNSTSFHQSSASTLVHYKCVFPSMLQWKSPNLCLMLLWQCWLRKTVHINYNAISSGSSVHASVLLSAALRQLTESCCDWLWWQGAVDQLPLLRRHRPDPLSETSPCSTKFSPGTVPLFSPLCCSLKFYLQTARRSVCSIHAYLWEDKSKYTHTHCNTEPWAEAQAEAVRLGKLRQHCFLSQCCKKWYAHRPARVFIFCSWLDVCV